MPHRFDPQVDHIRASLANQTGDALQRMLAAQLDTLSVAALATDSDGQYVAANTHARHLTGYSREELLALTVMDLTPSPAREDGEALWRRFIRTGVQHGTYQLRRKHQSPATVRYWAFANVAPGIHLSLLKSEDTGV